MSSTYLSRAKTKKAHTTNQNQSSLHFGCYANNTALSYTFIVVVVVFVFLFIVYYYESESESFACLPSCYRNRNRYTHRYGRASICLRQCLPFVALDKIWNCRLYLSVALAILLSVSVSLRVSVSLTVAQSARIFCSTFLMKSCYLMCLLFIYVYCSIHAHIQTYICVAFHLSRCCCLNGCLFGQCLA